MTRSGSVTGPERRPVTETSRRPESRGGTEFGAALSAEVATDAARSKAVQKQATQDRYAQNQAARYQTAQSQAAQDRRAQALAGRDFARRSRMSEPEPRTAEGTPSPKALATARMSDSVRDAEDAAASGLPGTATAVGAVPPGGVVSDAHVGALGATAGPVLDGTGRNGTGLEDTAGSAQAAVGSVQPGVGGTGQPGVGGTGQPGVGGTGQPSVGGTGQPSVGGTGQPSVDGTGQPSVDGTARFGVADAARALAPGMPGAAGTASTTGTAATAAHSPGAQGAAGQDATASDVIAPNTGAAATLGTTAPSAIAPAITGQAGAGPQSTGPQSTGPQSTGPQSTGPSGADATLATATLTGDRTGQPAPSDSVTAATTTADPAIAATAGATAQSQAGGSGQNSGGNTHSQTETPKDLGTAPAAAAFGGVPQNQPVAGPAPAAAPQAPLPLPGPPATQLAMRIAPLLLNADGVHRLTVHLHPADLGPVQVIAEIRNGEITVQLSGGTEAGNDALRNALDDLRRELDRSGFSSTTIDLRQGSGQQDQARQQFGFLAGDRAGTGPDVLDAESANEPIRPEPTGPDPDGRLDIKA